MAKIYQRTENGAMEIVSVKDAMTEVNHAMMDGKRYVREMSSGKGHHSIEYTDGRTVVLIEMEEAAPVDEQPEITWSTASRSHTLLHRFTGENDPKDRRALCNKRLRAWRYGNGYSFQTRTERDASEYGYLYTYCTRCEGK